MGQLSETGCAALKARLSPLAHACPRAHWHAAEEAKDDETGTALARIRQVRTRPRSAPAASAPAGPG
eukprot:2863654-Lingulodinium_polyedra.AAC.1